MKDIRERLEDLLVDAAECDLISNVAAEDDKRQLFRTLGEQYRAMALQVRTVIDARPADFVATSSLTPEAASND